MPGLTGQELRDIRRLYECGASEDEIQSTIPHEEPLHELVEGIKIINVNRDHESKREYFLRRWYIKARYNHKHIAKRDPRYKWLQSA